MPAAVDPRSEAVDRKLQPGPEAAGAPGGEQSPVDAAMNILNLVAQRLGEVNPEAAQRLSAAVENLKSTIEDVKREMSGAPEVATPAQQGISKGASPTMALPADR